MSFTGEFRHSIDAKGRLIVPSRLRAELEEDKVTLTVYLNGCIGMWSGSGWRDFERALRNQPSADSNARKFVRAIAASAHTDTVDKQGRITIPPSLRDWAGINRDVVVTGALSHAEIWSPEAWEREQAGVEQDRLDELVEGMSF